MQTGVAVGIAFAAVLVVVLINTWYVRRENNKDYAEMELRAPLVEFKKLNREEVAAMAAEHGHTPCHACAFDNFKDAAFCAVCGEALDETAKRQALKSKVGNVLSARRVRAAKRNEWTRKVDVEGKVFWYRKGTNESTAARFPGYAVTFEHNQEMAVEVGAGKTETLIQETQNATLSLVESSKADASAFAFGGKLESASHEKEVVEQAANLDFPSKYAAFVAKAATALAPTKKQLLNIKVDRKFIVEQALEHLSCVDTKYARAEIAMKFIQKQAGPATDMQRHWFTQLNELLGNPNTGLFTLVDKSEQTFYLNRHSKELVGEDHLTFLYAAGRLLGRGLLEGKLWSFHLSTPLLKIILGLPVSFTDLEFFDPEEYKNLDWLVKNPVTEDLGLDFSVTENVNGEVVIVDLIPNGRNIRVTDANKLEYLERRFKYVLFESVSDQLYAFLKGIYEVVPQEMLMVLDPEEFDYVLCGSDVIDAVEWELHSKYNETIHAHPSKKWFWRFVREMPLEYKKRLLHFTTGNTRVPIGGFAALTNRNGHVAPFTIIGKELVISRLIRAQPCFNQMELPTYVHKKELTANLFDILDNYDYSQ